MIYTNRTITVRKGESKIDKPIVVYRGDYELEVRFTITNSRFKFTNGTNLIETEKASFGQMTILTPYGGNIFSDIVSCSDGTITFVLTESMIDQIEEVGLYSFQIRLYDSNKESRVSIPPIEFGIEVREPIASEDHDNSVNNAIVGYSIAKVVDPKEENVGDTFDDNGNYNKTEWETGDRISEGKLNKIEDAINRINENEVNNTAVLSERIDNNFNILDSTKADISTTDSLQTQINNIVLESGGDNNLEVVQARGDYSTLNDRMSALSDKLDITANEAVQNSIVIGNKAVFTFKKRVYDGIYWNNSSTIATTNEYVSLKPGDKLGLSDYTNYSFSWYRFNNGIFEESKDWLEQDCTIATAGDYYILMKKNDDSSISEDDMTLMATLIFLDCRYTFNEMRENIDDILQTYGSIDTKIKQSDEITSYTINALAEVQRTINNEWKNPVIVRGQYDNYKPGGWDWTITNRCVIPAMIIPKYRDYVTLGDYEKFSWNVVYKKDDGELEYMYDWQYKTASIGDTIGKECWFAFKKLDDSSFTDEDIVELRSKFIFNNDYTIDIKKDIEHTYDMTDSVAVDVARLYEKINGSLYNIKMHNYYVNGNVMESTNTRCITLEPLQVVIGAKITLQDYSKYKWCLYGFNADGTVWGSTQWRNEDWSISSEWITCDHCYVQLAYINDGLITDLQEFSKQLVIENYYRDCIVNNISEDLFKMSNNLIQSSQLFYDHDVSVEAGDYYQKIFNVWNRDALRILFVQTDDINGIFEDEICIREYVNIDNRNKYKYIASYIGDGLYMVNVPVINNPSTTAFEIFIDLRSDSNGLTIKELQCLEKIYGMASNDSGDKVFYVAPDGDDTNSGLSTSNPLASVKKAIEKGATIVLCERGDYYNPPEVNFTGQYGKKIKIMPYQSNDYTQDVPDRPLINFINGNEVKDLVLDADGLLTQPLTATKHMTRVFIDKTIEPVVTGRNDAYYSTIWQLHDDETLDRRLKPVLTKNECFEEAGTMFYDGTNIFINPYDTEYKSFVLPNDASLITLNGYSEVVLEDIVCQFSYQRNFTVNNNMNMTVRNCHSKYAMLSDGFCADNSNCNFYNCTSFKSKNDGFNIHGYGESNFYNCSGYYNYDDGISHHDGCVGVVDGGEWHHNGKGGVSSPTHGACIDIYNIESHDNRYGIYAYSDSTRRPCSGRVFNSVLYSNTEYDFYIGKATIKSFNTKYTSKYVRADDGSLIEL